MSTDILTQLQTTYTQLLTQFYSTISYLSQRHPVVPPQIDPANPYTRTPLQTYAPHTPENPTDQPVTRIELKEEDTDPTRNPFPLRPDSPHTFANAQRELAEDLVLKAQQIQFLIERLPGLGRGEEEQKEEIRRLVVEVEEVEKLRIEKRKEMKELVKKLETVVSGMSSSVEQTYGVTNGHTEGSPSHT